MGISFTKMAKGSQIQFAVVERNETVDGLGALLEWFEERVRISFLSNPEVIPLLPSATSGNDKVIV